MEIVRWMNRNRWYLLSILFLVVNGYGVWRLDAGLRENQQVVRVRFDAQDTELKDRKSVTWTFSESVAPESDLGTKRMTGPIKIIPLVEGAFVWNTQDRLTFTPVKPWTPATEFSFEVEPDLRGLSGNPLVQREPGTAATAAPKLLSAQQRNLTQNREAEIELHFNQKIAPAIILEHLELTVPDESPVAYEVIGDVTAKRIQILTSPISDEILYLRLKEGLKSTEGPLPLEQEVTKDVVINDKLWLAHLNTHSPSYEDGYIEAGFSLVVPSAQAGGFIRVEPALEKPIIIGKNYYGGRYIQIKGPFKPGQSYTVTFLKGFPGTGPSRLTRDVRRQLFFKDRSPELRFTGEGEFMSPRSSMLLEMESVNVKRLEVSAKKIYSNNLVTYAMRDGHHFQGYYYGETEGWLTAPAKTQAFPIASRRNDLAKSRFPLRDLVGEQTGAFIVSAEGEDGLERSRLVVVTDTGISTKFTKKELLVWANSIRTLGAVQNARVTLMSKSNQVLLEGITDDEGLARLDLEKVEAGVPFLVVIEKGNDLSFLRFDRTRVPVPSEGNRSYIREGYEAFVFTDRGIYRPGETTHVKAVVRGPQQTCPEPFPVVLSVFQPDGRQFRQLNGMLNEYGTVSFDLEWADHNPSGGYDFRIQAPGNEEILGRVKVLVEDFAPPQITVEASTRESRYPIDDAVRLEVESRYLFGAAAAGCAVNARWELVPEDFAHPDWKGYRFHDSLKSFYRRYGPLSSGKLDKDGKVIFTNRPWPSPEPASSLRLHLSATVTEPNGRSVSGFTSCILDPYPRYAGLRLPEAAKPRHGDPLAIDLALVRPDGTAEPNEVVLALTWSEVIWDSVLKKDGDGVYRYQSFRRESQLLDEDVNIVNGRGQFTITPDRSGMFRLRVVDVDQGSSTSMDVYVGSREQQVMAWSMEKPDLVELSLDREAYEPGDTARLTLKAPFTGKALISLETDEVLHRQIVTLNKNTAEVEIPVTAACWPNAHCVVSIIRPVAPGKTPGAHRALGTITLPLSKAASTLQVRIDAPELQRPMTELRADIHVTDSTGKGCRSEVVLAAVDEGICMLTDFATPDPAGFFHATRQNQVSHYDLYALLLPDLETEVMGAQSHVAGGDSAALSRRLNPIKARRFKSTALWVGSVETDEEGHAEVALPLPEFTGELRLMAVAIDRERFGSADKPVTVRRPFVVQWSLPRFLAPGDACDVPVEILNLSGKPAEAKVELACSGPVGFLGAVDAWTVALAEEGREVANRKLVAANGVGKAEVTCRVTMNGETFAETIELPVRPVTTLTSHHGTGFLAPGQSTTVEVPGGWVTGTDSLTLSVAEDPTIRLLGGLHYLMKYPYGCMEQTTSASFPLLYLPELAKAMPADVWVGDTKQYVEHGIRRVLSMQLSNGSFSYWPGRKKTYLWGSVYASHFLVEAKKAGYWVADERLKNALEYLRYRLNNSEIRSDQRWTVKDKEDYNRKAYICYVLALAGHPEPGWVARLKERHDEMHLDSRIYLTLAEGLSDERKAGWEKLQVLVAAPIDVERQLGGALRSEVKTTALLLSACMDYDPDMPQAAGLVRKLEAARNHGRWGTTQDNAMALMALGKMARHRSDKPKEFVGKILAGESTTTIESARSLKELDLTKSGAKELQLENQGPGVMYYTWRSAGVPGEDTEGDDDQLVSIRRALKDEDGFELDRDSIKRGDLVIVTWTIDNPDGVDNLVVEDLLPAGFEIENARLKTSAAVPWARAHSTLAVRQVEARDDRMLVFPESFRGKRTYCYAVRAVTPGTFNWPPIRTVCMYDDSIRSRNGAGKLVVAGGGS